MNMSPLEYINQVRIRMACEHLKRTDEPIAEIAVKCGFSTNSTFNRNFKQLLGVTPTRDLVARKIMRGSCLNLKYTQRKDGK